MNTVISIQYKNYTENEIVTEDNLFDVIDLLLTDKKITIKNIPLISDVLCLIDILVGLGVDVKKIQKNTYSFEAKTINTKYLKSIEYQKNKILFDN